MTNNFKDPVNYQLNEKDFSRKDYAHFLDNLTDVPSSRALKPYTIDKAGINEQYAYIKIRSLFDKEEVSTVLTNIKMQLRLTDHRGIHMSRCEEALFSLVDKVHGSIDTFALSLAEEIMKLQESEAAYVDLSGEYIHKRTTVKSNKESHDRMTMYCQASAIKNSKPKVRIGLSVFTMTGCPCTETFTKFSVVPELKKAGFNLDQIKNILSITKSGTHTQRGLATLFIEKDEQDISYENLYQVLENSCHLVYELLKRPDEHELVIRVLTSPQFTEDVVRDIVGNVTEELGSKLDSKTKIFASSQLFDSIHIHDVYTEIDKTYGEILNERNTTLPS